MIHIALHAFAIAVMAMIVLIAVAPKAGLIDRPGGRKAHAMPTPIVGGLALAGGIAAAADFEPIPVPVVFALALAALIGALDDMFDVSKRVRIVVQTLIAIIIVSGSEVAPLASLDLAFGPKLARLLTVAAAVTLVVAVINALNWIDGIDGLLGTHALLITMALIALDAADPGTRELIWALAGGLVAFLCFNLRAFGMRRATVFAGDAGSNFLGALLAFLLLSSASEAGGAPLLLVAMATSVPLADMLFVMGSRMSRGKAPWRCDRTHVHHRLLGRGLDANQIVFFLSSINALILFGYLTKGSFIPVEKCILFLTPILVVLGAALFARPFADGTVVDRHPESTPKESLLKAVSARVSASIFGSREV